MARTIGRDIILQLIETTNELKNSMTSQRETVRQQGETLRELSNQNRNLSAQMASAVTQCGRLAKLLGTLAKSDEERFEEVEHRLSVLESAHG